MQREPELGEIPDAAALQAQLERVYWARWGRRRWEVHHRSPRGGAPRARAARRELQSAQSETRETRWATIRTIHSRDALVVENAADCILDPRNSATWGYRLGNAYAERYDPRHGTGLVPESAPLVRDIAEFWLGVASNAPLPPD